MNPGKQDPPNTRAAGRFRRSVFALCGLILVGIGFIGFAIPLLPSTIFFIFAAAAFARSSPRLETWLVSHAHFGPSIRAWRENRAISPRGKIAAIVGMCIGFVTFVVISMPAWPWIVLVALVLAMCGAFVATRPSTAPTPK